MTPTLARRLAEEHRRDLTRLAGPGRPVGPRGPVGSHAMSRRIGLLLVRAGRRLAGPDDLLDRRVAHLHQAATGRS